MQIIAAEDVCIGSLEAFAAAASSADPKWREQFGGDHSAIIHVTRLLAEAPKDRSAAHLIRLCRCYSGYDAARDVVGSRPLLRRLPFIRETPTPLHLREMAAWFACGLKSSKERRLTGGDLPAILDAIRCGGVPVERTPGLRARQIHRQWDGGDPRLRPSVNRYRETYEGTSPATAGEFGAADPRIVKMVALTNSKDRVLALGNGQVKGALLIAPGPDALSSASAADNSAQSSRH